MTEKPTTGKVAWVDLTIENAQPVRDFYQQVVGWTPDPVSMGDYSDFNMLPAGSDQPVAGICHARGDNKKIPPVWMVYITVANLEEALKKCVDLGGRILKPSTENRPFAVIEDPAGAICTLYQADFGG